MKLLVSHRRFVFFAFSFLALLYAGTKPMARSPEDEGDEETQFGMRLNSEFYFDYETLPGPPEVVANTENEGDWFDYEANTNVLCATYFSVTNLTQRRRKVRAVFALPWLGTLDIYATTNICEGWSGVNCVKAHTKKMTFYIPLLRAENFYMRAVLHSRDSDDDNILDEDERANFRVDDRTAWYTSSTDSPTMIRLTPRWNTDPITNGFWKCALPYPITLGGKQYTEVSVSINGLIIFGRESSAPYRDYANVLSLDALNENDGEVIVAPYWENLMAINGSNITIFPDENRHAVIIDFERVSPYNETLDSNNCISFQAVFFEHNPDMVLFNYNEYSGDFSALRPTVGIKNTRINSYETILHSQGEAFTIPSRFESQRYRFASVLTDPFSADADGDGLSDLEEYNALTNPHASDTDGDGLSDAEEIMSGMSALSDTGSGSPDEDTDGDGFANGWEARYGFNPFVNNHTDADPLNDFSADPDQDGLTNRDEYKEDTNPLSRDTDGDGVDDKTEIEQGTNPCVPNNFGQDSSVEFFVDVPFDIYGDYASWEMTIKGLGPNDYRVRRIRTDEPGDSLIVTQRLVKGNKYRLSMKWLKSREGYDFNWYCWKAQVGHLPSEQTFRSYSNVRCEGVAEIIAGDGWVAENYDGLLTAHIHEHGGENGGGNVAEGKFAMLYTLDGQLVPDYDRQDGIKEQDIAKAKREKTFRFWINDDDDNPTTNSGRVSDDSNDDLPNAKIGWMEVDGRDPDFENNKIDGFRDLIDFTPIYMNLRENFSLLPSEILNDFRYVIRHSTEAANVMWTLFSRENAGDFQKQEMANACGELLNQSLLNATLSRVTSSGIEVPSEMIDSTGSLGVFLLEGRNETTSPLILDIYYGGKKVYSSELTMRLSSVEDMYRLANLRSTAGGSEGRTTNTSIPLNCPDEDLDNTDVYFVHGYHVTENDARAWNAEMFKRLWQSGSRARFHAVTWRGDAGVPTSFHYNNNVCNAFLSANALATYVNGSLADKKIVMAHSLGNMVASSAIQDYNMNVTSYFMLNSAVPSEAYNAANSNMAATNPLVHDEWRVYLPRTWSAHWYQFFPPYDSRSRLTWKNRFSRAVQNAYNFYSSGDEVLELYQNGTPGPLTGATTSLGRYAWHKQESFKGRAENVALAWAATDWSGWGFRENWYGAKLYSAQEANAIPILALTTNIVFNLNPASMNSSSISQMVLNHYLAMGIPALSPPAGITLFRNRNDDVDIDLNMYNINFLPHGWWRNKGNDLDGKWLHSDIKNAAYYYIYPVFENLIEKGALK